MAASIEVIHNKINKKIFILREMIKSLEEKCEQKKIGHLELGVINSNLQAIKTSYDINTLLFINEFYAGNFDKNNNGEYRKSLIIHGILDSLDRILSDLEKFVNKFRNKLRSIAISKFIQEYRNIQIITVIPEEASWVCQVCDNPLTISYDETAVLCGKCGFTDDLVANLYEQRINDDVTKIDHGGYVPLKHCNEWIDNIEGNPKKEIPNEYLKRIEEKVMVKYSRKDMNGHLVLRNIKNISCLEVRGWLRDLGLTDYYPNVAQIIKKISGVQPYKFSHSERTIIVNKYVQAMNAYENIVKKKKNRSNNMYYPYVIYKIIEMSFPINSPPRSSLKYIHLQSEKTLADCDDSWKETCEIVEGFVYIPTDTNVEL